MKKAVAEKKSVKAVATKKVEKKVEANKPAVKKPATKKAPAKKVEKKVEAKKPAVKKVAEVKVPKKAVAVKAFHETKEFKSALKFAMKPKSARPILEGVCVLEDQIIATDSHRMIAIGVDIPKPYVPGMVYDKNGIGLDRGAYPQVDKIMDGAFKKATNEFTIDVKDWLDGHELMNILAKNQTKNSPVTLKADGKEMRLTTQDAEGNTGSYLFEAKTKIKNIDITYNATFMIDALKVFKDLGRKTVKIGFGSSATDIITMQDGNVSMIILPIRPNK